MGFRLWLVLAVWGVLSSRAYCSLGLTLDRQINIPEPIGSVQRAALVDCNRDGLLEVIGCDGACLFLYSPQSDSMLLQVPLYSFASDVDFLFADVNRDSIPDLVIGQYFDYLSVPPDTVCRVDLYDGASLFTARDSVFYTIRRLTQGQSLSTRNDVTLSAFDLSNDGYNELAVSFHKFQTMPTGAVSRLTTIGETVFYERFPSDTLRLDSSATESFRACRNALSGSLLATTRYQTLVASEPSAGTYGSILKSWVDVIDKSGTVVAKIEQPLLPPCYGDSSVMTSSYRVVDIGNIDDVDSSATELVIEFTGEFYCHTDGAALFDSVVHRYELYRLTGDDSLVFVTELPIPVGSASLRYLSQFPGFMFAVDGDQILCIDPLTGDTSPVGDLTGVQSAYWSRPPETDSLQYLITVRGRTLSFYRIDQVTDVEDTSPILPGSFELGTAFPNPFNSVVSVPVTTVRSGQATIDIINALGQVVWCETHFCSAGDRNIIRWDAGGVGSGLYLIRVRLNGETRTARAILLK